MEPELRGEPSSKRNGREELMTERTEGKKEMGYHRLWDRHGENRVKGRRWKETTEGD